MPRSAYQRVARRGKVTACPARSESSSPSGAGQARVVVHGHMQELPAGAAAGRAPLSRRQRLAGPPETARPLDVDVQQLARPLPLRAREAEPQQRLAYGRGGPAQHRAERDRAGPRRPPQGRDLGLRLRRQPARRTMRPRRPPAQPGRVAPPPNAPPAATSRTNSASANALHEHRPTGPPACPGAFSNAGLAGGSRPITRSAPPGPHGGDRGKARRAGRRRKRRGVGELNMAPERAGVAFRPALAGRASAGPGRTAGAALGAISPRPPRTCAHER